MTQYRKKLSWSVVGLLLVVVAVCGLNGCATGGGNAGAMQQPVVVPPISVGDAIVVVLSDIPNQQPLRFEDKVKEDGSITLHLGKSFTAAGKTALQLQKEIYDAYVPNIYKKLSVIVTTGDQYYTVTGYVRAPSQYKYVGPTTVSKAIATAGYFTDFGSHRVTLIRSNGQSSKVDYDKAIKRSDLDLPVFPGDRIEVGKKGPFGR
jgi:protein involved in polysaccharide export with SLBB domain